jgi:endogenous inhibitor of DNA gyrase (YacG/DUF329 family)
MATCPICNKDAKGRAENPAFPFCSPRCKSIDLGKWLNEEYRVPLDDDGDGDGAGDDYGDDAGAERDGAGEEPRPKSRPTVRH